MLNTTQLAQTIEQINTPPLPGGAQYTAAQLQSIKANAQAIANAIEAFVKSGTVSFTAGNVTGGTPANGTLQAGTAMNGKID